MNNAQGSSDSAESLAQMDIQNLQVKVAFLEDALAKLSDEYFAQQKELRQLSLTVEALIDKLASADSADSQSDVVVDDRPPHY